MPDSFNINYVVSDEEQDTLGLNQNVKVNKDTVYKVAEMSPRGLITTSGRLGLTTLNEVTAAIIADFGGRLVDWVVTLHGTVVATVHPDDSITLP